MSNCSELYIILKLKISSFRIWSRLKIHIFRLFGGFVMQGHTCTGLLVNLNGGGV